MTTWRWVVVVVAAGVLVGAGLPGAAWGQGAGKKEAVDFYGRISKDLITAAELKEFGEKNKAPEALLAAAAMLYKAHAFTGGSLGTLDEPVTDAEGNKLNDPAVKEKTFKEQAEDLIDTVVTTWPTLPGLPALIKAIKDRDYKKTAEYSQYEKFKARKVRSIPSGPRQIIRRVQAGAAHQYMIQFEANQEAAIAVQSNEPVRVVVVSVGENGARLVDKVVTTTRYTWVPRSKGVINNVKIEVHGVDNLAQYKILAH